MNKEDIVEKIKNYISFVAVINVDKLENDKSLRNYYKISYFELDEILIGIEDKFDVSITIEGYDKLDTINDITNIILEKKR